MIVRIATEGQYELGAEDVEELNRLDNEAVVTCESRDEQAFQDTYARLLAFVRDHGRRVGEDELSGSDVILPPPDVTLEEAAADFQGEGLIPG